MLKQLITATMILSATSVDHAERKVTIEDLIEGASTEQAVVPIPTAKPIDPKSVQCMARNLFHEARGESLEGQKAVFDVTMSRMENKRWPDSVCGVVHQYKQFSWTLVDDDTLKKRENRENTSFERMRIKAVNWLSNHKPKNDNVFHYAVFSVDNYWTRKMTKQKRIGKHVFYR